MVHVQLINCTSGGDLSDHEVELGQPVSQFLDDVMDSSVDLDSLFVRVNRRRIDVETYRLQDGDRVSVTPADVSGS